DIAQAAGQELFGDYHHNAGRLPYRLAQRYSRPQGRFVDLDDPDPCLFKVAYFITYSQCDLKRSLASELIVADKRPLQNGDWTRQHAIYGPGGKRLCILRPCCRHRFRSGDIATDDGRLHTARPVALYPTVGGMCKPGQLLAKIFDHIVPLKLSMHQHVEADFLLPANGPFNLLSYQGIVLFRRQRVFLPFRAPTSYLGGLRE